MYHTETMKKSVFFFKQKTAYEVRISDWSSDVCSSDLGGLHHHHVLGNGSGGRAVSLPRPQNLAPLHGVAVPPGTRRNVQLRTCSVRADQGWRSSIGILVS